MAIRGLRQTLQIYGQERVQYMLSSDLYTFGPLFYALARKSPFQIGFPGGTKGKDGKLGDHGMLLGPSSAARAPSEIKSMMNDSHFTWNVHGKKPGDSAQYLDLGFDPTIGAPNSEAIDDRIVPPQAPWAKMASIATTKQDIIEHAPTERNGLIMANAVQEIVAGMIERAAGQIFSGSPTTATNEIHDQLTGLKTQLDDDNTVFQIDRSAAANAGYRAERSDTALNASLDLIRAAVDGVGVKNGTNTTTTRLISKRGGRPDIVITTPAIFDTLRSDYERKMTNVINQDNFKSMAGGCLGFTGAWFLYDGMWVAADDNCQASHIYILNSRSIEYHVKNGKNFKVNPPVNPVRAATGVSAKDRMNSLIELTHRLIVIQPGLNCLLTNVTA